MSFDLIAAEQFEFLVQKGFVLSEVLPTRVCYAKGDVVACVYHGRISREIGFEVTFRGETYSLTDVLAREDPAAAKQYRRYSAWTDDAVRKGIRELRHLVERYGHAVLDGEPAAFAEIHTLRAAAVRAYARDVKASQVRPKAETAFRSKDYARAITLYNSIADRLTPVEQKKLEFARKRVAE